VNNELEESGLIEVLSQNFPEDTEENHENLVTVARDPPEIRTAHLPNKCIKALLLHQPTQSYYDYHHLNAITGYGERVTFTGSVYRSTHFNSEMEFSRP
jgi:hypothetical protein